MLTFISSKDHRISPAGVHEMSPRAERSPYWSAGGMRLEALTAASTTSGDSSSTGGARSNPSGRD